MNNGQMIPEEEFDEKTVRKLKSGRLAIVYKVKPTKPPKGFTSMREAKLARKARKAARRHIIRKGCSGACENCPAAVCEYGRSGKEIV